MPSPAASTGGLPKIGQCMGTAVRVLYVGNFALANWVGGRGAFALNSIA